MRAVVALVLVLFLQFVIDAVEATVLNVGELDSTPSVKLELSSVNFFPPKAYHQQQVTSLITTNIVKEEEGKIS